MYWTEVRKASPMGDPSKTLPPKLSHNGQHTMNQKTTTGPDIQASRRRAVLGEHRQKKVVTATDFDSCSCSAASPSGYVGHHQWCR
jgi:hypothetical protein